MSSVTVTLPDGSTLEVASGATVEDVAHEIGPGLGRDTVAGKIDHELVAKEEPISEDCEIEIVTDQSDEYLDVLRHTAAHVLAQAIRRHHPDAKLTIGPYTDEGFYYDIANVELDADDLDEIQAEAASIIDDDLDVERVEYDRADAREHYADNEFKREILDAEAAGDGPVSFYTQGDFEDLCKGPHVDSTGEIGGFEVLETSAAYWRGDEERETLTRVYGTAFPTESDLQEYLARREEAKERDHRKLGREMDLFSIPDVTGPGLPLYHPNGKTVLRELSEYVRGLNSEMGYDEVETPHLFRTELWKQSGHYDNYVDDMFLLDVNDEEYGLKPMNCPGHATIFNEGSWSYRDLPVRYFEDGKVYRKEQRGELSGLSRVWAFTIDDGHVFARADQIEAEVRRLMDTITEVLDTFDLDYEVALATR
ncbi:TGS domain-containing protein, partial [Halobacterium salinarum]|nr:TGS domain-containing protein [Halobacterium salinarum]